MSDVKDTAVIITVGTEQQYALEESFRKHRQLSKLIVERINTRGHNNCGDMNATILLRRLDVAVSDLHECSELDNLDYSDEDIKLLYGYIEGMHSVSPNTEYTVAKISNKIPFREYSIIKSVFNGILLGDTDVSFNFPVAVKDIVEGITSSAVLVCDMGEYRVVGPFVEGCKLQLV